MINFLKRCHLSQCWLVAADYTFEQENNLEVWNYEEVIVPGHSSCSPSLLQAQTISCQHARRRSDNFHGALLTGECIGPTRYPTNVDARCFSPFSCPCFLLSMNTCMCTVADSGYLRSEKHCKRAPDACVGHQGAEYIHGETVPKPGCFLM